MRTSKFSIGTAWPPLQHVRYRDNDSPFRRQEVQPSALFASHVEINRESVQRKIEILRPNHKNIFYISCDQLSPLASPRRTPLLYNHVFYVKGDFLPPTIGPGNHLHMGVQRNSHLILGYVVFPEN